MASLPPRQVGQYQLVQVLGEGTSGTVFLARRPGIERLFALKLLVADLDAEGRERVKREARIASRLDHPGIVRVLEIDVHRDRLYLVMDHAPGPTLRERLDKGGPFSPSEAASVVAGLADALHAAHAVGIVHRDVKPDNVVIDGRSGRPRILDFGVASDAAARTKLTLAGQMLGTPYYMSPEQVRGEPAAPAADVYALGVVLYELLTGVRPFEGTTTPEVCHEVLAGKPAPPSTHAPGLDSRVEQVVLMAMARDPGDRFPTAAALAEALRSFVSASGESSGEAPSGEQESAASAGPWPALVACAVWTLSIIALTGWVAIERRDAAAASEAAGALAPKLAALRDAARVTQGELEEVRAKVVREGERRASLERERAEATEAHGVARERLLRLLRSAAEPRPALGDALPGLVARLAPLPGAARLRAQLLLDAGLPREATDVCRAAIASGDHDPELLVHAMRGFVALRMDAEARDAHAQLMRLSDAAPERAYALLQMTSLPLEDRLRGARRAAPFPADAAYLHVLMAEILSETGVRQGDAGLVQDALLAADTAVRADPCSGEAFVARSTALYHQALLREDPTLTARIVADLRRARQISPATHHWTWAGKSFVLAQQPLRALAELEVATRAAEARGDPIERANVRAWLGNASLQLGDEARARALWVQALQLAPMAPSTYDFARDLPRASEATRQAVLDAAPPEARRELQRLLTGDRRGR